MKCSHSTLSSPASARQSVNSSSQSPSACKPTPRTAPSSRAYQMSGQSLPLQLFFPIYPITKLGRTHVLTSWFVPKGHSQTTSLEACSCISSASTLSIERDTAYVRLQCFNIYSRRRESLAFLLTGRMGQLEWDRHKRVACMFKPCINIT
jgi:hypothetical protein